MRFRPSRGMIIGIVVTLIIYFFILPAFWPDPTVELHIPRSARFDRDAPVTLIVSSWHSNVEVASVYLVANCDNYR